MPKEKKESKITKKHISDKEIIKRSKKIGIVVTTDFLKKVKKSGKNIDPAISRKLKVLKNTKVSGSTKNNKPIDQVFGKFPKASREHGVSGKSKNISLGLPALIARAAPDYDTKTIPDFNEEEMLAEVGQSLFHLQDNPLFKSVFEISKNIIKDGCNILSLIQIYGESGVYRLIADKKIQGEVKEVLKKSAL